MDELELLTAWRGELAAALGIDASMVDIETVLALAKATASGVARPAVPLTGWVAGVALGRALAAGADPAEAFEQASRAARDAVEGHSQL